MPQAWWRGTFRHGCGILAGGYPSATDVVGGPPLSLGDDQGASCYHAPAALPIPTQGFGARRAILGATPRRRFAGRLSCPGWPVSAPA